MFIFVHEYQTLEFDLLFSIYEPTYWTGIAFLFLVFGAFAKSAQFIFHGWLPDAMEGPTPVSALLHSATMVTAGVFLMLRFMDMLATFDYIRFMVTFFGLLTALYAMSVAAVSDDTKRVTAYTTLNQLGFMFFGCASLAGSTVLFHLIVHGLYKSFSFLVAACELHDLEDEQDGESDALDPTGVNTFYDLLSGVVFLCVNAIPFSSPSISKEFILISGMESVSDYFTFLIMAVLFASPVDEGREDYDDYPNYLFYTDDAYVPSAVPFSMNFSVISLGVLSILSSLYMENFFLDMAMQWSYVSDYSWITARGSSFIILPFLSVVYSEFDTSRITIFEDFSFRTIFRRSENRYQALLLNAELWYLEERASRFYTKFYSFTNYLTNQVLDKGYLEYYFVALPLQFIKIQSMRNKPVYKSAERIAPYVLLVSFFTLFLTALYFTALWFLTIAFFCEFTIIFINLIKRIEKYESS